ncbi:MAG TPA: sensor domain-containing diguanylate cyclase [Pyrinomonadaceae bacterium]|nr:sensor domain-containing diguanylate cyclase [Pyrinomonadaceae bacterium]
MYSLYHSLIAQHSRQLTPVRCAESTISQLSRYFEDIVLENNLAALVIESLPTSRERLPREMSRLHELGKVAQNSFLMVTAEDTISRLMLNRGRDDTKSVVLEKVDQTGIHERFVVIADARFSALLASVHSPDDGENPVGDLVVWTFEPDIVFSALEYLMARMSAEHTFHAAAFADAVRVSMPKATSLQLTLGVTTKLARLLQEQAEREIAVNRIATAMRSSQRLDEILQTAANEVGRALSAPACLVRVESDLVGGEMTKCAFNVSENESRSERLATHPDAIGYRLTITPKIYVDDDNHRETSSEFAQAAVPLIFNGNSIGFLLVRSDDPKRVWADNELLLLDTVADQLTVSVNQARLFAEMEQQALTDALTGCYNRRSFDLQLERDLQLAIRMRQSMSLVLIDLDYFKRINDRAGHNTGDIALRMLAEVLRTELRAVDTAVRLGGDEFAVILPQANVDGALIVAERLRARIEKLEVPGYGHITASLGLASFPHHAYSRANLVAAADRALYNSKHVGRNCVSPPPEEILTPLSAGEVDFSGEKLIDSLQNL